MEMPAPSEISPQASEFISETTTVVADETSEEVKPTEIVTETSEAEVTRPVAHDVAPQEEVTEETFTTVKEVTTQETTEKEVVMEVTIAEVEKPQPTKTAEAGN